jgi:hypothetical protein
MSGIWWIGMYVWYCVKRLCPRKIPNNTHHEVPSSGDWKVHLISTVDLLVILGKTPLEHLSCFMSRAPFVFRPRAPLWGGTFCVQVTFCVQGTFCVQDTFCIQDTSGHLLCSGHLVFKDTSLYCSSRHYSDILSLGGDVVSMCLHVLDLMKDCWPRIYPHWHWRQSIRGSWHVS